jgi:protein phosphatase
MTSLRVGSATDTGRIRTNNQDSFLIADTLFAVADGMGGHRGGEVASAMAVEALQHLTADPTPDELLGSVQQANHVIFDRARNDPDLRGMGTTLCAVALVSDGGDEELAVVNVGDSRVYLLREDELIQLTRDHSLVEDMLQEGRITAEEAAVHPQRNIVTRALGIAPRVDVDEFSVIPHTGDRFILCSDGLFNEITTDRIAATLRRLADPDEAAHELVRLANENGGRDNITCVVVEVLDDDGRAERAAQAGTALIRTRDKRPPDVAGFATAAAAAAAAPTQPVADDGKGRKRGRRKASDEGEVVATRGPATLGGAGAATSNGASAPEPPEPPVKARAFTWRTALFILLVILVIGAVLGALTWYGRGAYFVGYDSGDTVTIYKGRPGGFLWFHPTYVESTGVARSQVPGLFSDSLEAGKVWSSRSDAEAYVSNIRKVICEQAAAPSTATTTTLAGGLAGPTTTLPAECRAAAPMPAVTTTTTRRSHTTTTTHHALKHPTTTIGGNHTATTTP